MNLDSKNELARMITNPQIPVVHVPTAKDAPFGTSVSAVTTVPWSVIGPASVKD